MVRNTLGRFFQRIADPTKTEQLTFTGASGVLNSAIDNLDRLAKSGKRSPRVVRRLEVKNVLDSMTIEEIKVEVEEGNLTVEEVLLLEESGKNRSTLIAWLEEHHYAEPQEVNDNDN